MLSVDELAIIMRASHYLEQNLARMAEVAGEDYGAFLADWRLSTAAERLVQTSVDALQDIARPLARQRGAPRDVSGREALLRLQADGAVSIEEGLVERMTSMRNRVVHNYADVDLAIIYDVCVNHRADLSHALAALLRLTMDFAPPPPDEGTPPA